MNTRKSGVLLHPTSLPGPYGIGELGQESRNFIDRLVLMGQQLWQILPMGPTGYGDSPYQSLSTFAGNDLIISFDDLVTDGLLSPKILKKLPHFPKDHVDFGRVIPERTAILTSVCKSFKRKASKELKSDYDTFTKEQAFWLNDYALFSALKKSFDLRPWIDWPQDLAQRNPHALKKAAQKNRKGIEHIKILQFLFDRQWHALRRYANDRGIKLIGDIPIFVAHDSVDVWSNRSLFHLNDNGNPTVVAGVPPDYFSTTGQLWGNPLYDWAEHSRTKYAWWIARMRRMFDLSDIVRIDHFRAFDQYWEIPSTQTTAINGKWVDGPKHEIFNALTQALGETPIIAEDLGLITPSVDKLRDDFNFPGMRILQFSFADDLDEHLKPHGFPENCAVYTGTHDNDTTIGWLNAKAGEDSILSEQDIQKQRETVLSYLHTDGSQIHWDLIALGMKNQAHTSITPLQDLFGLGTHARMNIPGRPGGNWQWRFEWTQLNQDTIERYYDITEWGDRLPASFTKRTIPSQP